MGRKMIAVYGVNIHKDGAVVFEDDGITDEQDQARDAVAEELGLKPWDGFDVVDLHLKEFSE